MKKELTPMMAQYQAVKAGHRDALLLFRLGDFYEMFFEDAEIGSQALGIALTARAKVPMCGVPHHSVGDYIKVLVEKGHKVAICEQMEDPSQAKGIVKRDVTRVITPGTYWEGAESASATYLVAVHFGTGKEASGLAACDLSTGEVLVADFLGEDRRTLAEEVGRLTPKEVVVSSRGGSDGALAPIKRFCPGAFMASLDPGEGDGEDATDQIFGASVPWVGTRRGAGQALEILLRYLQKTQVHRSNHLRAPVFYLEEGHLEIDPFTRRNLELLERLQGGREGTLLWVLDRTKTAMGSRLLKRWIERPLTDPVKIGERHAAVECYVSDSALRQTVRQSLSSIRDLPRLVTKISYGSCNARDLVALAASLEAVPKLASLLTLEPLCRRAACLDDVPEVVGRIRDSIASDPPVSLTEGGLVRGGYNAEIDELRDLADGGKRWMLQFEAQERERTGIRNLRIGYNRVFGYYIEVTRSNQDLVPDDYERRQTLASAERYTVPLLKEKEAAILGAQERLNREEYRIFLETRDYVASFVGRIQATASAVAEIDVLASFGEVSVEGGYVRPTVADDGRLHISQGRHPVLERVIPPGTFVPNDTTLDEGERVLVITGPNMGGKSTFCRQVALIVIMGQIGCFVPAKSAALPCVDKVFARVGAFDDLVLGQSTFMVEMTEVARILGRVTPHSLVILDEIGRGTSTFDGLSVAWAVVEHLAGNGGPKALVATHYRELTLLSDLKSVVANYNVLVKKTGPDIVLLHRVTKGIALGSFGIEVSAMAGLPPAVVARAKEILGGLETEARRGAKWRTGILGHVASRSMGALEPPPGQASLFGEYQAPPALDPEKARVLEELLAVSPDSISPMEALQRIYEWKKRLSGEEA